jgi:hypothetical protein
MYSMNKLIRMFINWTFKFQVFGGSIVVNSQSAISESTEITQKHHKQNTNGDNSRDVITHEHANQKRKADKGIE